MVTVVKIGGRLRGDRGDGCNDCAANGITAKAKRRTTTGQIERPVA
jgi:hypothetical protein